MAKKKVTEKKSTGRGKPFTKEEPSSFTLADAKLKAAKDQAARKIDPKKVDKLVINELVNESVAYLLRGMRGRTMNKKEKLETAKLIASKSVPKDLHLADHNGESLVDLIKEMHKKK